MIHGTALVRVVTIKFSRYPFIFLKHCLFSGNLSLLNNSQILRKMFSCMLKLFALGLVLGTVFNYYEMGEWVEESFDDLSDQITAHVGEVFGPQEEGRLRRQIKFEDDGENFGKVMHKKERFS